MLLVIQKKGGSDTISGGNSKILSINLEKERDKLGKVKQHVLLHLQVQSDNRNQQQIRENY